MYNQIHTREKNCISGVVFSIESG